MANRSKQTFMGLADRLKDLRRERGLTQKGLSELLGKSESAVRMWELGKSEPDLGTLNKLAEFYGIGANDLIGIGRERDGIRVPVVRNPASWISNGDERDVVGFEAVSSVDGAEGKLIAFKAFDDSMEPRMMAGDTVIVRVSDAAENGSVAVLSLPNGEVICRRVLQTEEGIFLHASNAKYPPLYYSAHQLASHAVRILGTVIELRARF